jgi:radical SAM protein with 4Fe4S-binding SPASM domain
MHLPVSFINIFIFLEHMKLFKLKHRAARLLNEKDRKRIKNFYYDNIVSLFDKARCLIYYRRLDFPDRIDIETTTYCNLRCSFCPNSKYPRGLLKNKKLMDLGLFNKIIDELTELKFRGSLILAFYGEPLTDKRMPNLIRSIKDKLPKSRVIIYSNGTLLTIELYKELVESGIDIISISQHGKEIPLNVKKVFEYLESNPEEKNKLDYRTFNEDTFNDEKNESIVYNVGGEIKTNKPLERPPCKYYPQETIIDADGNVIPCCNDYHSSIKFGNLKNQKLIEIWDSLDYRKFRKELRKNIYNFPVCRKCVGIL